MAEGLEGAFEIARDRQGSTIHGADDGNVQALAHQGGCGEQALDLLRIAGGEAFRGRMNEELGIGGEGRKVCKFRFAHMQQEARARRAFGEGSVCNGVKRLEDEDLETTLEQFRHVVAHAETNHHHGLAGFQRGGIHQPGRFLFGFVFAVQQNAVHTERGLARTRGQRFTFRIRRATGVYPCVGLNHDAASPWRSRLSNNARASAWSGWNISIVSRRSFASGKRSSAMSVAAKAQPSAGFAG